MNFKECIPTAIPERNKEMERFGLCVVRTLESIASEIAKKPLHLSNEEIDIRLRQLIDSESLIKKRFVIPEFVIGDRRESYQEYEMARLSHWLSPIIVRMDKMHIERLISKIKENSGEVSNVFNNADIKYINGDLENARDFLEQGWKVGVITAGSIGQEFIEQVHVFHLGLDQNRLFVDKSDNLIERKITEKSLHSGELGVLMVQLQRLTKGWNLILVRSS